MPRHGRLYISRTCSRFLVVPRGALPVTTLRQWYLRCLEDHRLFNMDSLISILVERSSTADNATRGPQLLAAYWTEAAIVILVLLLRFRVRWSVGGIWADDWIMAFTGVS